MTRKSERPEEGPACGRCGITNRPARSFCRHCGAFVKIPKKINRTAKRGPVAPVPPVTRDEDGHCSDCGEQSLPQAPTCPRCGARFKTAPRARTALPRARRPPKPVSERRRDERATREEVVAYVTARDDGKCQAGPIHALVPGVRCGGRLDPHERIPRSAWAKGYLVADNVLLVCEHAHRWIDHHPHGAHALGFHGFSWERPATYVIGVGAGAIQV